MPRAGLSRAEVVRLALEVLDAGGPEGFEQLTLSAVAARAGVAVPSLYKHVGGLPDLRREVALVAVRGLTDALRSAGTGGPADDAGPLAHRDDRGADALAATAHALRGYARRYPARYAAGQVAPDPADPANAELLAANAEAVRAAAAALRPLTGGLTGAELVHTVRVVRSAVHGFVLLEQHGGFGLPERVDDSFDHLVAVLQAGLRR
jgi:AcrR family transcriptional regulator